MLEEIRKLQKSILDLVELMTVLATRLGDLEEKFEEHSHLPDGSNWDGT